MSAANTVRNFHSLDIEAQAAAGFAIDYLATVAPSDDYPFSLDHVRACRAAGTDTVLVDVLAEQGVYEFEVRAEEARDAHNRTKGVYFTLRERGFRAC